MTIRSLPLLSALPIAVAVACASPPPAPLIDALVLQPGQGERVSVDQVIVLVDSSGSLLKDGYFRDQKALVESLARSMPEGRYQTSTIVFGGYREQIRPLAPFGRSELVAEAEGLPHLDEGTPIHTAIAKAGDQLEGHIGRAAVVLFSDGDITDGVGREIDPRLALDAARQLSERHEGPVCFHTVQTGPSTRGAALLQQLAQLTDCGSFRSSQRIDGVASLHQFERDVFLGGLPAVAAAPSDSDLDGVIDAHDLCPGTPRGAKVDERGCWIIRDLYFATDSAEIDATGSRALDEVAEVLEANPGIRVRVDGHTDSRGSEAYNQQLSQRRAEAARDYLIRRGIDAERVGAQGFGETRPAAENTGETGRRLNRRTEITVLR